MERLRKTTLELTTLLICLGLTGCFVGPDAGPGQGPGADPQPLGAAGAGAPAPTLDPPVTAPEPDPGDARMSLSNGDGDATSTEDPDGAADFEHAFESQAPSREYEEDTRASTAKDASYDGGSVLTVTPALYEALLDLQQGESLADPTLWVDTPGLRELWGELETRAIMEGSPNAYCANVRLPSADPDGCTELDPLWLDAGSHDVDAQGGEPIESYLERWTDGSACGLGRHDVDLFVADEDGNFSSCTSSVELCDADDPGCIFEITSVPIAVACAGTITCHWVVTGPQLNPTADTTLINNANAFVKNGIGSKHHVANGDLTSPMKSCWADSILQSGPTQSGDVRFDANVVCTDSWGNVCQQTCQSEVEAQAYYRSNLHIDTELSSHCFGLNDANAHAQDEATFTVGGAIGFQKAASLSNGSSNTYATSFTLGAKSSASEKGASAEVSASMGVSVSSSGNVGRDDDTLNAFGSQKQATPTTVLLQSKGKSGVTVRHRSWGVGRVSTEDWLTYFVGTSQCPGAGTVARGAAYGKNGATFTSDLTSANNFFQARGVNASFPLD